MGNHQIFKPAQRPWFIAKTLAGRLLQGWFVLFFILTWAGVKKYIFAEPDLIGPLPAPLFWIWFLDFCTIVILFVAYHLHYKKVAERVDHALQYEGIESSSNSNGGAS